MTSHNSDGTIFGDVISKPFSYRSPYVILISAVLTPPGRGHAGAARPLMMEQGIIMYTILLMCILQDSTISCDIGLAQS